ncbi:MAG: hypothetical protein EG823_03035 [Actinobacteria bacterium]|nr:hypothetical protein [Actinomycetota bacterium]
MILHDLRYVSRIALVAALGLAALPALALAAPMTSAAPAATEQAIRIEVRQPVAAVTSDGKLDLSVAVAAAAPAEYLEVRVRLRSPAGRLVYQKTEVRSGLPAGEHVIRFERDLADLGLERGRYPIEVRVLATGSNPTTSESRLLVLDPDAEPLPVAIVVSVTGTPAVTVSGRFSRDPAIDTGLRDDLAFIAQLALARRAPLCLAVPPVLLEQLARTASGYETTAGVAVPATADEPLHCARMLDSLRSAVETGTIELVDVPYGLPDLAGLSALGAEGDLAFNWAQTDVSYAQVLRPSAGTTAAYFGGGLTREALDSAEARGVACVLASGGAMRSKDSTATPGCYSVAGSAARVVVVDETAAAGARSGADAFYDALFSRMGDGPVVVLLDVGSGKTNTAVDVQHALDWIAEADWLELSDIASLSDSGTRQGTISSPGNPSDPEYWADIADSRSTVLGYVGAVDPQDADAISALRALLVAESGMLSEGDEAAKAEGLARMAEAYDFAAAQFALIRLDAKDVTLSGSKGDVPLTLINDTGRKLRLTLTASSASMRSTVTSQEIVAQPTQNFLTLPVDLGNSLDDTLELTVRAGDITVAEATVDVRASYIDRLAIVLMVVVVLAGMLVFIRRRVGSPVADTIREDRGRTRKTAEKK